MGLGGVVIGIVVLHSSTDILGQVLLGWFYGLMSYGLWWGLVTYAGSVIYDGDDGENEPENLTVGVGVLCFILPVMYVVRALIAIVVTCMYALWLFVKMISFIKPDTA